MRVIATLLLAVGVFALPSQADDEGSCSSAQSCSTQQVANSCYQRCPVAREALTMGRKIVVAMPVAIVDRSELEA